MNIEKLEQIKEKALEDHIPIIMDDTLEVIKNLILEIKPKNILEIGTAVGYSAICFCQYLEQGHIDTIEKDEQRAKQAMENIKEMELEDKIQVYTGDAVEILATIKQKYDLVFIDAAKGKYPVFLKEAIRLTNDGGMIVADNILYKGYVLGDYNKHKQRTAVNRLREYIKEAQELPILQTKILDIGDGLAISKKIMTIK